MEEELEAQPEELDNVADFVATFASIPEGTTTDDWLNRPASPSMRGSSRSSEGMRRMPRHRGPDERRHARTHRTFSPGDRRWWIARMIRNPRSSDKYGFLTKGKPGQMPAFGDDQITCERPASADPLLERRLRRSPAVGPRALH